MWKKMSNTEEIKEIKATIQRFAEQGQYSVNNEYVKALYRRLRDLENRPQIKEESYEEKFIDGSDVPVSGRYE